MNLGPRDYEGHEREGEPGGAGAGAAGNLGQSGKAWENLLRQFDAMEQAGDKAVGAAYRRAMLAGPAPGRLHEEALAYYIEAHPDLPFARKVLAWLRMMLRKLGETFEGLNRTRWMRWANTLSTDDLLPMAQGALRGAVRDSGLRRNGLSKRSFSASRAPNGGVVLL